MHRMVKAAIDRHKEMVAELERGGAAGIEAVARLIVASLKAGGTVYICGNGGSAADAQHIAGEMVGRFMRERKALAAAALTTDTSVLTSVGNDYGYNSIFVRQVEGLVKKGDVLWALSTSGSSPNIVEAAELAKKKGANVVAFTGRSGSRLERIADACFCAADPASCRSQEIHQLAYHIVCDIVEAEMSGEQ
ncbi:MAG TPA: SIS domain-containing protein [Sedimentisphaerales bacterium]|nr:SIS domain-containing protein [Sedimentisphaerales bacterium]